MKRSVPMLACALCIVLLSAFVPGAPAFGQAARFALVIGNGNYAELGKLKNPVNDAHDIADALKGLGFQVEGLYEADLATMEDAVVRLGNRLSTSKDAVGFFFYAGHAVQSNGINFLIPADAHIASESFLKTKALAAQEVLDVLQDARNVLNVVVLDACRDNPFSWARSGNRGLTIVGTQPPGSIVAYATSAGKAAQDGTGRNGVFTAELLKVIRTPGIEIKDVFNRAGAAVQAATGGAQVPAVYNQYFGSTYLAGQGAAAAGGTSAAGTGGALKVAILAPLTGSVPTYGTSTRNGALLAIKEWNAKGGVLGMSITPVFEDSQCSSDAAVTAAKKVIAQDKVRYIIGEVCSAASISVAEIVNAAKVIQVSPTSTSPAVTVDENGATRPYSFRACFVDSFQGTAGATFAYTTLKARNAFVVADPSVAYVKGLADAFEAAFMRLGGRIVGKAAYGSGDKDFSSILSKVTAGGADLVFLPEYYPVVNRVLRQARAKGITTVFLGGDGWNSPHLDTAAAAPGYFVDHYSPDDQRPEVQRFLAAYTAAYKDGTAQAPDSIAALAYDAANLLLTAIAQAGTDDTDAVRAVLGTMTYVGATGVLKFDSRHNPIKSACIFAVKGGSFQYLTTIAP